MPDCSICVEPFNKIRKPVPCPHCQVEICSVCVRHYLTENTIEPKCMNCNVAWNMEFLRDQLPKSFMDKEYKKHQIQGLVGEAETRIDIFQQRFRFEKEATERSREIANLRIQIKQLQELLRQKNNEYYRFLSGGNPETQKETRETFFMACPRKDCRGRISTAYKCGLCEHWVCPDCHMDKGVEKNGPHQCKEEDKETVRVLKENTKQCPKCHTGIYKTEGCDQMWCVSCHTCFSWKTGVVLTGAVHNPHYYEFMRQQNGGVAPRAPGDIPCGGLPPFHQILTALGRSTVPALVKTIQEIYRMVTHIQDVTLRRVERETQVDDLKQGVDYVTGKTTREQWGQALYVLKRRRERAQRYRDLVQMITGNGGDIFRNFVGSKDTVTTVVHLERLFKYANEQVVLMNRQFGTHRPLFEWKKGAYKF